MQIQEQAARAQPFSVEMAGLLKAISIVSRRLAASLEQAEAEEKQKGSEQHARGD